ncbi:MAG: anti-sigma factor [bacterium]|nr:anti-sigma factor [bacterium]
MSSIEHHDELRDLAMLYTLGALETNLTHCEDLTRIEAHLHECDECRHEVAMAQVGTAMLARSAAEEPPSELKSRVMAATLPKPRRKEANFASWTAIAAAIALLLGFAALLRPHPPAQGPVTIRLQSTTTAAAGVVHAGGGDNMTVDVANLAPLPAGRVYQLWAIAPGSRPAPGPTFSVGNDGKASVAMHAPAQKGLVIAVTVEPSGGSQAPTTRPFLAGKLE